MPSSARNNIPRNKQRKNKNSPSPKNNFAPLVTIIVFFAQILLLLLKLIANTALELIPSRNKDQHHNDIADRYNSEAEKATVAFSPESSPNISEDENSDEEDESEEELLARLVEYNKKTNQPKQTTAKELPRKTQSDSTPIKPANVIKKEAPSSSATTNQQTSISDRAFFNRYKHNHYRPENFPPTARGEKMRAATRGYYTGGQTRR